MWYFWQIFQNLLGCLLVASHSDKFFKFSVLLEGQRVSLPDFFDKPSRISSPFFEGDYKICQLRMMKTMKNRNSSKRKVLISSHVHPSTTTPNIHGSRYKVIIKEYHKKVVCFLFLEGDYFILPYRCCGYLHFVIDKHIHNCIQNNFLVVNFMVFTSEVTTFHHIWKSVFSSISRSQFSLISKARTIPNALNTANASHRQFTRFTEAMVSPPWLKIIRYSWSGLSMSMELVICILQQEQLLFLFQIFFCGIACNMYNFSTIGQQHECVLCVQFHDFHFSGTNDSPCVKKFQKFCLIILSGK